MPTTTKTPPKSAGKPAVKTTGGSERNPRDPSKPPALTPLVFLAVRLTLAGLLVLVAWTLIAVATARLLTPSPIPVPDVKQNAVLLALTVGLLTAAVHTARRRWWAWRTRGGTQPVLGKATPARREQVIANLTPALSAVLLTDGEKRSTPLAVEVAAWKNAHPTEVTAAYPPSADTRVHDNLQQAVACVERLHPPKVGRWQVSTDGERFRVTLRDVVDPLAVLVPKPDLEADPDPFAGVALGIGEDGQPWRLPLTGGMQTLVVGATGSGKGSPLYGTIRALAPLIGDGRCRLWVADPKGGVEFAAIEGVCHRFAVEDEDIAAMLVEAAETMKAKLAGLRGSVRKVEKVTRQHPLDLVVVDELASVIGEAALDKESRETSTGALARLLVQGRAPLFSVLAATQRPQKENLKLRDHFTQKIALRLELGREVALVLGEGARDAGATADLIPASQPGTAYVAADGVAGYRRVRAAFVSDADVEAMAAWIAERQEASGVRPGGALARPVSAGDAIPVGDEEDFAIPAGLCGPPEPAPAVTVKKPAKARRPAAKREAGLSPAAQAPVVVVDEPELVVPPVPAGERVLPCELPVGDGSLWHFDGDADPVLVVGAVECEDDPSRWEITYTYPGETTARATDVDEAERLTRA